MKAFRVLLLSAGVIALPAFAQVTVISSYSQNFDSLGTALPDGWSVWTSSSATGNGTSFTWNTAQIANNATFSSTNAFRNLPGASQTWTATGSAGSDRALGWRAGDAGTRDGSIVFTLTSTSGWNFDTLGFQLFTPNSSGSAATFQFQYQIGASGTFMNFSPTVSYTTVATPVSGSSLTISTFSLTSDQLVAISNQADQVTLRFENTATSGSLWNSLAVDNFSYSASAVPEPSTYAAIAGSVVLAGACWQRRRKRNS